MGRVDDKRAEDARLVTASRAGDPTAFPALFDRWFDRCVDVAWRILLDRDAAADVTQEAFLAAWQGLDGLRDPASFGGWVLRMARNRALDRLARDRRAVAVGDDRLALAVDGSPRTDETAAVLTRAEDADLVWAASAALGERDASLLDLHLRHELAVAEIAEAMGVTPNNAPQLLFRLRKKLSGAIRAWVLWRDGDPSCDSLAAVLAAAGITRFGAEAVRVTARHVEDCADCASRQHLRLAPEALFAAVPVAPVAPDVKAQVAASLQAEGVPVTTAAPTPADGPPDPAAPQAESALDSTTPQAEDALDPTTPQAGSGPDGTAPSGLLDVTWQAWYEAVVIAASAVSAAVVPGRTSSKARVRPRLGMKGNGWAGSMAMGVTISRIWLRKRSSRNARSASVNSSGSTMTSARHDGSVWLCSERTAWWRNAGTYSCTGGRASGPASSRSRTKCLAGA